MKYKREGLGPRLKFVYIAGQVSTVAADYFSRAERRRAPSLCAQKIVWPLQRAHLSSCHGLSLARIFPAAHVFQLPVIVGGVLARQGQGKGTDDTDSDSNWTSAGNRARQSCQQQQSTGRRRKPIPLQLAVKSQPLTSWRHVPLQLAVKSQSLTCWDILLRLAVKSQSLTSWRHVPLQLTVKSQSLTCWDILLRLAVKSQSLTSWRHVPLQLAVKSQSVTCWRPVPLQLAVKSQSVMCWSPRTLNSLSPAHSMSSPRPLEQSACNHPFRLTRRKSHTCVNSVEIYILENAAY